MSDSLSRSPAELEKNEPRQRWLRYLRLFGLRLLRPEDRLEWLPEQTQVIYQVWRVLEARLARPPHGHEVRDALGGTITTQAVWYHVDRLRIVGLLSDCKKATKVPDHHDITLIFTEAMDLLGRWVLKFPQDTDLSLESQQVIDAFRLHTAWTEEGIPAVPEWFIQSKTRFKLAAGQ